MNINTNAKSETKTALDALAATKVVQLIDNGTPFAMVPDGYKLTDLEGMLENPTRIRRTVTLHDPESFISYVNRFKEPGTTIFFDQDDRTFRAVLDYHESAGDQIDAYVDGPGPDNAPDVDKSELNADLRARWCSHGAIYTVRPTPEWTRWVKANLQTFRQADFTKFVEDNIHDVADEYGTTLLKIALNLEVRKDVWFTSTQRQEDGTNRLIFEENVNGTSGTGSIQVPPSFFLQIQPFMGGPTYRVECRLRFRLQDRAAIFWFEMVQVEKLIETALGKIRTGIEELTGMKSFAGE